MKPIEKEVDDLVTKIGGAIDGQTTSVTVSALLTCLMNVIVYSATSQEELTERVLFLAGNLTDPDVLHTAWTGFRGDSGTTH